MNKPSIRDLILITISIVLAAVVLIATIVYLTTEQMIPGLIPLASAALMVPNMLLYAQKRAEKLVTVLFAVACVLNLIAGIMQIAAALI